MNNNPNLDAAQKNTEMLWELLNAYLNDADGITKWEALEILNFDKRESLDTSKIFDRALKACRRRAEQQGLFIPRSTSKGARGYAYVLTDKASIAMDGYLMQGRVARGTKQSAMRHEMFIDRHASDLPPVLRTVFQELKTNNESHFRAMEEQIEKQQDQLEKVYAAYLEEAQVSPN